MPRFIFLAKFSVTKQFTADGRSNTTTENWQGEPKYCPSATVTHAPLWNRTNFRTDV